MRAMEAPMTHSVGALGTPGAGAMAPLRSLGPSDKGACVHQRPRRDVAHVMHHSTGGASRSKPWIGRPSEDFLDVPQVMVSVVAVVTHDVLGGLGTAARMA